MLNTHHPRGPSRGWPGLGPSIRVAIATCALVAGTPSLRAQLAPTAPPPGFALSTTWEGTGLALSGLAHGNSPDEVLVATDFRVEVHNAQGFVRTEFTISGTQTFSVFERRGDTLLWSDFNNSLLHLRDLPTGQTTTRALPANTFSLDRVGNGPILVAAAPSFPTSLDTEIHEVVANGPSRLLGTFRGPSGPLWIDRSSGDLFYGEQSPIFPSPPGSLSILRLPASVLQQALNGTRTFTEADASVFATGFDGLYDLCADDRGRLLATDPQNGGVVQLDEAGNRLRELLPLDPSAPSLFLAFVDGDQATLDPHQPESGGRVWVGLTDFSIGSSVVAIEAEPPTLFAGGGSTLRPGRRTDLRCEGVAPSGAVTFALSLLPAIQPRVLTLSPNGAPLWSATDFTAPPFLVNRSVDASGRAVWDLPYAGGLFTQFHVEAIGLDPSGQSVATSNVFVWTILP